MSEVWIWHVEPCGCRMRETAAFMEVDQRRCRWGHRAERRSDKPFEALWAETWANMVPPLKV